MRPARPLVGIVAAVHTPFRADGSLHLDAVDAQAAHLRAQVGGPADALLLLRHPLAHRSPPVHARVPRAGAGAHPHARGDEVHDPGPRRHQLCLRAGDGGFDVPYGVDEWLLAPFALGARGHVGSTYNFAAPLYVGPPRLPHVALAPAQVAGLRGRLEALGFFEWLRPEAAP